MRDVLIIGAGSSKKLAPFDVPLQAEEPRITTLDFQARHKPDVVWNLEQKPWPFQDCTFDEVHAYEVLEHLGRQGDVNAFFADFWEIWRILKPGGHLGGSSPLWSSKWAWGDPGHTRIIGLEQLTYLDRPEYEKQVGKTAMTDYRDIWFGDFELVGSEAVGDQLYFLLKTHKPVRA